MRTLRAYEIVTKQALSNLSDSRHGAGEKQRCIFSATRSTASAGKRCSQQPSEVLQVNEQRMQLNMESCVEPHVSLQK